MIQPEVCDALMTHHDTDDSTEERIALDVVDTNVDAPIAHSHRFAAIARALLRLGVTIVLAVVLLTRVNVTQAIVVLQHLALPFAMGACGLMLVVGACSAIRWRMLLTALGVMTTLATMIRLTAISIPWNLVIPGGESGTLVRAAMLARQQPAAKGKIWASIVVEHLILVVAEVSVGGIALLLAQYPPPQLTIWLVALGVIVVAMVGLSLLFLLPITPARLEGFVTHASRALVMPTNIRRCWGYITGSSTALSATTAHDGEWLAPLWNGLVCYRGHVWALLRTLAMSMAYYVFLYAAYWLVAQGLGITLGYADIAWLVALTGIATHLPITVAGVGVREGILLFFLTQRGVAPATALAFSIAILALNFALGIPGLLLQTTAAIKHNS